MSMSMATAKIGNDAPCMYAEPVVPLALASPAAAATKYAEHLAKVVDGAAAAGMAMQHVELKVASVALTRLKITLRYDLSRTRPAAHLVLEQ